VQHNWSLISPSITLPRAGSVRKWSGASRVGDKAAVGREDPEPRSSSSKQGSRAPHILIGKTGRTLVFKAIRKEVIVAIKVCQKPTVKESADTCRNDMKIMSCLNHVSIIRRTSFACSRFHIAIYHKTFALQCPELTPLTEYVGQDLSKLVDEQGYCNHRNSSD
jgi:hypothetical protein